MVIMNRIFIMTFIVILTITIIGSSSLTNVLAKGKVTMGPVNCEELTSDSVHCCAIETGSDGIEITWCTVCDNTSPPSNCTPRGMYNPNLSPDTSTPDGKDIDKDQILSPPKSNEGSSQKNSMNPQQALTSSKSN
jgi:hypothetical protein